MVGGKGLVREYRLKKKLKDGKMVYGMTVMSGSPNMIEVAGWYGFDWIFLDMEHTEWHSWETINNLCRTCDSLDMAAFVRVPKIDRIYIQKAMEAGAEGVLCPHGNTVDDIKTLVQAIHYPPYGIRGVCPFPQEGQMGRTGSKKPYPYPWMDLVKASDEGVVSAFLCEEKVSLENINKLLSVKDYKIDAVWLGTADMSMTMGVPMHSKKMDDAYETVLAACRRHKVWGMSSLGQIPGGLKDPVAAAKKFYDDGGRILMLSNDISAFHKDCIAMNELIAKIEKKI